MCLSEERIIGLFVADGSGRSVSRIDACLGREGEEVTTDAFAKLIEIATRKVGTPDASLEEHVARKEASSFLAIEHDASRRMSRYVDCLQLGVAKGDGVSLDDVATQGRLVLFITESEVACHGRCLVQPELVLLTSFGTQAILLEEVRIAEDVVQVQVCAEHVLEREVVLAEVVLQALLLFGVETSRVYHYGLARFVGEDVAVHGEHIEFEFLYFHSIQSFNVIQTTERRKNLVCI